jgi:hypothetical protein
MTLLNLDLDMGSSLSLGLFELLRIWRNLKVTNMIDKICKMQNNGATGAIRKQADQP